MATEPTRTRDEISAAAARSARSNGAVDGAAPAGIVAQLGRAVTQQLQGRQLHFETVGQYLLGLEPDLTFV